jgi:hypothetical protein
VDLLNDVKTDNLMALKYYSFYKEPILATLCFACLSFAMNCLLVIATCRRNGPLTFAWLMFTLVYLVSSVVIVAQIAPFESTRVLILLAAKMTCVAVHSFDVCVFYLRMNED